MQISVQKSFLIEFCHWGRGWLYEVDVEDAISLEVIPVDRPEGEDFDSSAASCWPGNVRVMTAVFEPSSDFIEVDHADPHSEPPAPPDSRNWGICLGPVSGVRWCHHQYNANTWASTNTNTILCHNGRPARGIPRTALYTISGIGFISRSSNHVSHCWLQSFLRFPFSDFGVRGNTDRRRPLLPWSIFPSWHLNAQ